MTFHYFSIWLAVELFICDVGRRPAVLPRAVAACVPPSPCLQPAQRGPALPCPAGLWGSRRRSATIRDYSDCLSFLDLPLGTLPRRPAPLLLPSRYSSPSAALGRRPSLTPRYTPPAARSPAASSRVAVSNPAGSRRGRTDFRCHISD